MIDKKKLIEKFLMVVVLIVVAFISFRGLFTFDNNQIKNIIKDENYTIAMVYEEPTDDWKIVKSKCVRKETDNLRFVNGSVSWDKTTYFYKERIFNIKKTDFYSPSDLAEIDKEPTCYVIRLRDMSLYPVCKTDVNNEPFKIVDKAIKDLKIKLVDNNKE